MNEELDSQLSAMFDDELPEDQCQLLARRLSRDDALKARWRRYAVMGADQAASTLLEITVAALRRGGHEPDAAELEELRRKVEAGYQEQTDVRYAAARLWVDRILDPAETRAALLVALDVATRHDEGKPFRTGVLQV